MNKRTKGQGKNRAGDAPHQLHNLEPRQLMAVSLPFRLDFASDQGGVLDKDGQGTGFTQIQVNKLGSQYVPTAIDLNTTAGTLAITATGNATNGSNSGTDNTLTDALETTFDATTSGFTITARLIGPLGYIKDAYEQAGIYFGPDQDNWVKLVATKLNEGQFIQFRDEINGANGTIVDANSRVNVGSFANISTLDLRLVGDGTTGVISAYYSINGQIFTKVAWSITVAADKRASFFNSNGVSGLIVSNKNNLAPITATFDSFEITAGTTPVVHPSVRAIRPGTGATDVNRDIFVAADVNLVTAGAGIDTKTISADTVYLYRNSDGAKVAGVLNTSGGGDAIVFTPTVALDANSTYTFVVTDGVKDITGVTFASYTSSFTTGTQGGTVDTSVAFSQTAQTASQGVRYTSMAFGPDGKLYATTIDGKIYRFAVGADGTLGTPQIISTIINSGPRTAIGLAFDPASTASDLILYVSTGEFSGLELKEYEGTSMPTVAANWTGQIVKLTGANLQTQQVVVTGLPRSARDHQTYSLAFGPDGKLYVSQASQSAMGAPDTAWGNRPETLLSAAVLQVDVAAIGAATLDVRTEGVASPYNPYAAGAAVKIYATGMRSGYDLLFHSNGHLYMGVNGSAAGGNTPAGNGVVATTNNSVQADYLLDIAQGGYYGHPNPLRNEYVLNGGNPTAGIDPAEVTTYPVGTTPDANYRPYAYSFGYNYSPNGMIEYKGNAFGGALNGSLMVVRYSGGDDIMVMKTDAAGKIVSSNTNYYGLSGFVNPLDLIQNPATGDVYVIEFGDQAALPGAGARITLLKATTAPTSAPTVSLSRNYVYMSDSKSDTTSSSAQTIRITNTGNAAMIIDSATFAGANKSDFSLVNPITAPITLQPGERYDFYVVYTASNTGTIRTATVSFHTNDPANANPTVNLRAVGMSGYGGTNEPSLQRILDLYQIGINVGDDNAANTAFPIDTAVSADEIKTQRLIATGTGAVTVELLGVFANQNSATTFGWYDAGSMQNLHSVISVPASKAQSVSPTDGTSYTFDPGTGAFGLYGNFTLGSLTNPLNRTVYSEAAFNSWESVASRRGKIKFYQMRDSTGAAVANTYVFAMEEYNVTYDQNDIVGIIRNVTAAPATAEIGLENRDGVPASDRLVMSRIRDIDALYPNEVHDTATLRVWNTGDQPLNITDTILSNADFTILTGGGAQTVAVGAYVDMVVKFIYNSTTASGNQLRTATLTVKSDDSDEGSKVVTLAGIWQSHSENMPNGISAEPTAQTVITALGYNVSLTFAGQSINTAGNRTRVGQEVLSDLWTRADNGLNVTVRQLVTYHQQKSTTLASIKWYNPTNIDTTTGKPISTTILTHRAQQAQTILPTILGSTTNPAQASFVPSSTNFGFKVDSVWSQDALNVPNAKGDAGHGMRFYPARDNSGKIIANTYIVAQDYVGVSYSNYDYQDNIYLVTNIKPVDGPTTPTAPTAIAAAAGITLDWANNTEGNLGGYNVYRSDSATGTFTKINAALLTDSAYVDTTAPYGTPSYYRITAVDYHGTESTGFATTSATRPTTGGITAPAAPSGLIATAGTATSIGLSWTDNANNETGFKIERKIGSGAWVLLTTTASNVTTYTDTTASASTTYTYRVRATNAGGDSLNTSEVSVTTPAASTMTSTNIGAPTPTGTVTTVTTDKDYDVSVGGADIYGTADSFNFISQQKTGDFDVKVQVIGLTATDPAAMAGIMVRESLATGARNIHIKARSTGFRVTYRAATNGTTTGVGSGAMSFPNAFVRLQRVGNTFNSYGSSDGVNWTLVNTQTLALNATVYLGLATCGHSTTSAAIAQYRGYGNFIAQTAPATPTALVATATSSSNINLTWTDNATTETGYRVERSVGASGVWTPIASLAANTTSYSDSTASSGTNYSYRVIATAVGPESSPSNVATATTPGFVASQAFTTSGDAYVRDGTYQSTNYGAATEIQLKMGDPSYLRIAYLKFDLSSLVGRTDISSLKFQITGGSSSAATTIIPIDVVAVASSTWSESTITYANRPTMGATIGSISAGPTAQTFEIDLTAYALSELAAGRSTITLGLRASATTSPYATFKTKEAGTSAPTIVANFNVPAPTAPSNLSATATDAANVALTWIDNATTETSFRVERRDSSGTWTPLATLPANSASYTDSTVAPGTTYDYRVIAVNASGEGVSNIASATTPSIVLSSFLAAHSDAYVQDGTVAGTNYGTGSELVVKQSNAGYIRQAYIKFDISSLAGKTVNSVKLQVSAALHVAEAAGVNLALRGVPSSTWNESTLTWNNKPAPASAILGTTLVTDTTFRNYTIDITAYVKSALAAGQTFVTLNLQGTVNTNAYIRIQSKESGNGAKLVINS